MKTGSHVGLALLVVIKKVDTYYPTLGGLSLGGWIRTLTHPLQEGPSSGAPKAGTYRCYREHRVWCACAKVRGSCTCHGGATQQLHSRTSPGDHVPQQAGAHSSLAPSKQ